MPPPSPLASDPPAASVPRRHAERLPLVPFERYMLADDRPGWPMDFYLAFDLATPPDPAALRRAVAQTVEHQPLLRSVVAFDDRRLPHWHPTDALPEVRVGERPTGEPLDLSRGPGLRLWTVPTGDGSELWFQCHHVTCDGVAAVRLAAETLARAAGEAVPPPELPESERHAWLRSRGRFPAVRRRGPARLLQDAYLSTGIAHYFALSPKPYVSKRADANPESAPLGFESHAFDPAATSALRDAARSHGGTVNDLLLRDLFHATAEWQAGRGVRGRFRVMVPMSLRDAEPPGVPACNRVGMSHVDRPSRAAADRPALLRSLVREMDLKKRHRLGVATNRAVGAVAALVRDLRPFLDAGPSKATTVLSNLGDPFDKDEQARRLLGRARGTVRGFRFASPVRPGTPAVFGAVIFDARLTLSMRYQPAAFPAAPDLFALVTRRIEDSAAHR